MGWTETHTIKQAFLASPLLAINSLQLLVFLPFLQKKKKSQLLKTNTTGILFFTGVGRPTKTILFQPSHSVGSHSSTPKDAEGMAVELQNRQNKSQMQNGSFILKGGGGENGIFFREPQKFGFHASRSFWWCENRSSECPWISDWKMTDLSPLYCRRLLQDIYILQTTTNNNSRKAGLLSA